MNQHGGDYRKLIFIFLAAILLAVGGVYVVFFNQETGFGEGFVSGNGRIEATETDISTKLAGRIVRILVEEGDFVTENQLLAVMQTDVLEAQRNEAAAQLQLTISREVSAKAQITLRESDKLVAEANLGQRKNELDSFERRLSRSTALSKSGSMSQQEFDNDDTGMLGAQSAVQSAKAQVAVAEATIDIAKADAQGAFASITAAEAAIARIEADISDSQLTAPRGGRVRIAQPGEVMAVGGKLLNMVDLTDVYMTFFLPETVVGRVAMGEEVRIILDANPDYALPASISYVASTAQFTPKTVETQSERQKLMFQVKARIDRDWLLQHLKQIKTGLPGVAWIKLDPQAAWPESMTIDTLAIESAP
jgi:HlyD family secretion protein